MELTRNTWPTQIKGRQGPGSSSLTPVPSPPVQSPVPSVSYTPIRSATPASLGHGGEGCPPWSSGSSRFMEVKVTQRNHCTTGSVGEQGEDPGRGGPGCTRSGLASRGNCRGWCSRTRGSKGLGRPSPVPTPQFNTVVPLLGQAALLDLTVTWTIRPTAIPGESWTHYRRLCLPLFQVTCFSRQDAPSKPTPKSPNGETTK